MKGLEISEIKYSELEKTTRIDAEYYSPRQLGVEALLDKRNALALKNWLGGLSDGNHMGISEEFCDSGIPYYRGGDVHSFFIENSCPEHYISEDVYNKPVLARSHLAQGDVLVTIVGTIGNVAVVTTGNKATCNCKIAIARPNDQNIGAYLAVYLSSFYGQCQIQRIVRGSVQMGLVLEDLGELPVPKFSVNFTDKIALAVKRALALDNQGKHGLIDAETSLLRELGFADWQPPTKTVAVRKCSDFMSAGRFDAEYFQPKYDELLKKLDAVPVRHLGGEKGLATFYKSEEPGSDCYGDEGVPFVRIADLSEMGIGPVGVHVPSEVCADCRRPKKDTILLSKDGSVDIAYKVEEDLDVVTSGGILHLTVVDSSVLPDYLTLVLNSKIVRMQAERDAGGSIIQHWKPSEIANVIIPVLPMAKQKAIVKKVQASFAARKESKRLLELAKRAVEVAIESGESAGLAVIKGE